MGIDRFLRSADVQLAAVLRRISRALPANVTLTLKKQLRINEHLSLSRCVQQDLVLAVLLLQSAGARGRDIERAVAWRVRSAAAQRDRRAHAEHLLQQQQDRRLRQ